MNYVPPYSGPYQNVAKTDYAGNGGDLGWNANNQGTPNDAKVVTAPPSATNSIAQIEATTVAVGSNGSGFGGLTIGPNTWSTGVYTGVFWQRSETSLRMIGDGTSKVYMLGEKYMGLFDATLGATGSGDEENIYVGMDDDNIRLTANGGITKSTLSPNKNIMCPTCYVPPQQDAAVWAFNETTLASRSGGGSDSAGQTRRLGLLQQRSLRQFARWRVQHGVLRWLSPFHHLRNQLPDAHPTLKSQRRPDDPRLQHVSGPVTCRERCKP